MGRLPQPLFVFDSVFYSYVGLAAPECTLRKNCGGYLTVEHNGDIFACDFFVTPEWKLGNVLTGSLQGMLNGPTQQAFGEAKARLPEECMQCRLAANVPRWMHEGPADGYPGGRENLLL